MKTATTTLILFLSFTIWYLSAIPRYYRLARKTGLPLYFTPVNPSNPLWLIIVSVLGYDAIARFMPKFLFDRVKLTIPGWEYRCKYTMNHRLGVNFVLVSPGCNTIFIGDPDLGNTILIRRKEFGRIEVAAQMLGVFGPNLISVDHDEWKRHRRIVAPILNERIMSAVWDESRAQADEMLGEIERSLTSDALGESDSTFQDMKTITINVIGSVGFGNNPSFTEATNLEPPKGFKTTSMKSILTIVNNIFPAVFIPAGLMTLPFMPNAVQELGFAKAEFPQHLKKTIADERCSPTYNNTLIASLVRIADQDTTPAMKTSKTSTYLSEDEITGNLFNFTIAGFDTTANTLTYAIAFLALYPEWQDWVIEGIHEDLQQCAGDYSTMFPLLTRCLALMFETLRLNTPVSQIARVTHQPQNINNIHFPQGTHVQVSIAVIHSSPEVWGEDSLEFRPSRWLEEGQSKCETLIEPDRGSFMPWSGGPRLCPGMKMAQVEFVAVISSILKKWKVQIATRRNETPEAARERFSNTVAISSPGLTMQMVRPRDAVVKWVRR